MLEIKTASYGSWLSPITSDLIVAGTFGLRSALLAGAETYWVETRPKEAGRCTIMRAQADGTITELLPAPFNARTRVHEYGGGELFFHKDTLYFSNFSDQQLYKMVPGSDPSPITNVEGCRYADGSYHASHNQIFIVREDHRDTTREAINTIVRIDLNQTATEQCGQVIVSGSDFYASPKLSPDGRYLAWICWQHPNMPWDSNELWLGELDSNGNIINSEKIAGGAQESVFQPEWSPEGVLYFISDPTGWWNFYRYHQNKVEPLCPMSVEFGRPQWVFGQSTYAFISESKILCSYVKHGFWQLAILDTTNGELTSLDSPYTEINNVCANQDRVIFFGGSATEANALIQFDLVTEQFQVLRRSSNLSIDKAYISVPVAIEFPTTDGKIAHAFYYAPHNSDYVAPEGEKPPLIVKSHGGPTAATSSQFSLGYQYWTSRGFALLDVNYGGSTGYGREYRERLNGQWGIVDVDDCLNGARHLVRKGLADEYRLAIHGGSAGGYTTLCALTFHNLFKAGASYYGVSDLVALDEDTHKFESRYSKGLIGPYPERKDLYHDRSPINFTDQLSCPVIIFQGLEDKVVPPNQAEMMVNALRAKGLPVAYVAYEGEQHGFRKAENIKRTLDGELYFYGRIFKFELAEPVEPVTIENLA